MVTYSHSKLGTFQQCKHKYKLQYVDKIKVDIPDTVETFMGKLVHETLEKLYKDLKFHKLNTKKELTDFYEMLWKERWTENILMTKEEYTSENYKSMGKKFIEDYYSHYRPFGQITIIGLETEDRLELENGNQYHIKIDRLSCDKEGNYYVCDYKTNNKLKAQGELDEDRQLAMYSLWVKKNFKDCKNVKLIWYFLAFDKEMISERNDEQLSQLKLDTENLIKEVESCTIFPATISSLCDWCKFQPICPAWKHKFEVKEKKKEFKDDDGVKIVDEFAKLKQSIKETEEKIEELKNDIIEFTKQKEIDTVFGTDKKCSVKEYEKVIFPEDKKEELIKLLKDKGIYEEFSLLNYFKLKPSILKKEVDEDIIKLTDKEKAYRLSLSKRKDLN